MARPRRSGYCSLIQVLLLGCVTPTLANAAVVTSSAGSTARHAATPAATADPVGASKFVFPPPSHTDLQTLAPTTTADVYDPADLVAPGTGRLSLREAFTLANQLDIEVTIVLQHGAVYRLERCGPFDAPVNSLNELVHTANHILTISGSGATIFQDCEGAGVIVQQGGDQLLNLAEVVIKGGRSRHVPGGGVWSSGTGPVRISNMVLVDNEVNLGDAFPARISAGAVASNGDIVISGATFAHNRAAEGAGAAAAVGAIKAVKASFYANSGGVAGALQGGRVVAPPPPAGPPPMIGRTPDGITLIYATLESNSRPQIKVTAGKLTSFASVISATGDGPLCDSSLEATHSLGFSYASGGSGCGFGSGTGDVAVGAAAHLASTDGMARIEVLTPTRESPLRDAIPSAACLPPAIHDLLPVYSGGTTDELGVARPQGAGCDIGAIEAVAGSLSRPLAAPLPSDLPVAPRWGPENMELNWAPGAIRVTTREDEVGGSRISLRDVFARANAADHDTVAILEPGTVYRLVRCVPTQAARDNETNELVQTGIHTLTIYGNGSTILQTCDGSAVIKKYGDARLILNGLTIAGGRSVLPGGGIFSAGAGDLILQNCWVTDNVSNAAGGGIAAFGSVVLLESTLSNNLSFEFGGGMAVTADATAVNSSIFDNTAGIANGGIGIHGGIVTLLFSTVAHNTSPNIAAGRLTALGSIIASPVPPRAPPGGIPEGVGHGAGPGGPPAGNCMVGNNVTALSGNFATDTSCGFANTGADAVLVPNRPDNPTALVPRAGSPVLHALSAESCAPYRDTHDQLGTPRFTPQGCDAGAVAFSQIAKDAASHVR